MFSDSATPIGQVLVVDDNAALRLPTARALARAGFVCQSADTHTASRLLGAQPFDAIVAELRPSHPGGAAFIAEVAARKPRPVLAILTAVVDPTVIRELVLRGADDVSFKPIDLLAFAAKVRGLVERQRLEVSRTPVPRTDGASSEPTAAGASCESTVPRASSEPTAAKAADDSPEGGRLRSPNSCPAPHAAVLLLKDRTRAQSLAAQLTSLVLDVLVADRSESLRDLFACRPVDILIVEQELSDGLSGLEVIASVRQDFTSVKVILLTSRGASPSPSDDLSIDKTLPATSGMEEFAAAVNELLIRGSRKMLIPPLARKLVADCGGVRPLPQLLTKLLPYFDLDADEIPLHELADAIAVDSGATASLLAVANSSSSGLRNPVSRVFDAVTLLGARRSISIVMTASAVANQTDLLRGWSEPLRHWYGRRSVLIASAASVFARRLEGLSPDTAFVLGLLQDIGIPVLGHAFPGKYVDRTLRRAREVAQAQLDCAEKEDCGVTHAAVSAALLQKWGLPNSLVRLVLEHHSSPAHITSVGSAADSAFLRVMRIGEALADLLDLSHPIRRQRLNRLLQAYPPQRSKDCLAAVEEAVAVAEESCRTFAVPVPDDGELQSLIARLDEYREHVTTSAELE